jgi:hypothetical protein
MIVNLTEKQILTIKFHLSQLNLSPADDIALLGKLNDALESERSRKERQEQHIKKATTK